MKEHILYFDVLRVVAILAVIILHVAVSHFHDTDVFSFMWEMSNMWDGIVRWGVPVFVMISGALFLNPEREITFNKLYSKNILHLVIVLLFWSVFYALCGFIAGPFKGNLEKFVVYTVLGNFHLWFLWMVLGLYIIVPLLRPICKDIKLVRYFLFIGLFFSFLIPTFVKILTGLDLIKPNSYFVKVLDFVNIMQNEKILFHFTLGYVAYFVLGYYIHSVSVTAIQRKIIYILGILGGAFTVFYSQIISQTANTPFNIYDNLTINVLFESLAVFVFVKYNIHHLPKTIISMFSYLSKYVLGIYLAHAFIQSFLSKFLNISANSFNPLFSIPLIALLIFVLSWIITAFIKRIPILNKYII